MKDEGVFTYPTGAADNVLKLKPPMTFTAEHADLFVTVLDDILGSDW
jgi:4-aminobutyrate aminotransferase-like enzyme